MRGSACLRLLARRAMGKRSALPAAGAAGCGLPGGLHGPELMREGAADGNRARTVLQGQP